MDSIRENRLREDVLEEIRMMFAADLENELCVVIVEGSDDAKFMNIVLEDNVTCIESPYGGKHGIMDLMTCGDSTIEKKEVIAIRDKDYTNIEQLPARVFVYDGCCLETMILLNSEVAENFYREYYRGDWGKEDYLINIMRQLAPYSILRRMNDLERGQISFRDVGFGDLVTEETLKIEELFNRVQQTDKFDLCVESAGEILDDLRLWDITNGHDLCTYLGKISKLGKKKDLGEANVRNVLFGIYRKSDFKTTRLYRSILEYQNINRLRFIKE